MKITRTITAQPRPKHKRRQVGPKRHNPDTVKLSTERWYTPAVNIAKCTAISGVVGAGLAAAGLLGGLPAVGLAALTGAVIGGRVGPTRFSALNTLGTLTSFAAATALGTTGPLGIVGGAVLGAGLCLHSSLLTNQSEFG
jgi:hypothetical protein